MPYRPRVPGTHPGLLGVLLVASLLVPGTGLAQGSLPGTPPGPDYELVQTVTTRDYPLDGVGLFSAMNDMLDNHFGGGRGWRGRGGGGTDFGDQTGTYTYASPDGEWVLVGRIKDGKLVIQVFKRKKTPPAQGSPAQVGQQGRNGAPSPQLTEPHIIIVPDNGGPRDSVSKTQTFRLKVVLRGGAATPDQISVTVTNPQKFVNGSQTVTLTRTQDFGAGATYVSADATYVSEPIKIEGQSYWFDWISVKNGEPLTATYAGAGPPVQVTFKVYDTPLKQAIGRNEDLIGRLKSQLTRVMEVADRTLPEIDNRLKSASGEARDQLLRDRQTVVGARDLVKYKLEVIDEYFRVAYYAPTHDTGRLYEFTDQFKFQVGRRFIPILLQANIGGPTGDRAETTHALYDARNEAKQEVDEIQLRAMQLLAIGLYQAVTELTLAGPAWTLLSPVANSLVSPDAVEGGGTFSGTTIWGTTANRDDYLHAASSLLWAAAMTKGVPKAVDALGEAIAPGYRGRTPLFEGPKLGGSEPGARGRTGAPEGPIDLSKGPTSAATGAGEPGGLTRDAMLGVAKANQLRLPGRERLLATAVSTENPRAALGAEAILDRLGRIDSAEASARTAGVPAERIRAILDNAGRAGTIDAWSDVPRQFELAKFEHDGNVILTSRAALAEAQNQFGGTDIRVVTTEYVSDLVSLKAKMALAAREGTLPELTPTELGILQNQVVPRGDGILRWYSFDGQTLEVEPIFDRSFLRNLHGALSRSAAARNTAAARLLSDLQWNMLEPEPPVGGAGLPIVDEPPARGGPGRGLAPAEGRLVLDLNRILERARQHARRTAMHFEPDLKLKGIKAADVSALTDEELGRISEEAFNRLPEGDLKSALRTEIHRRVAKELTNEELQQIVQADYAGLDDALKGAVRLELGRRGLGAARQPSEPAPPLPIGQVGSLGGAAGNQPGNPVRGNAAGGANAAGGGAPADASGTSNGWVPVNPNFSLGSTSDRIRDALMTDWQFDLKYKDNQDPDKADWRSLKWFRDPDGSLILQTPTRTYRGNVLDNGSLHTEEITGAGGGGVQAPAGGVAAGARAPERGSTMGTSEADRFVTLRSLDGSSTTFNPLTGDYAFTDGGHQYQGVGRTLVSNNGYGLIGTTPGGDRLSTWCDYPILGTDSPPWCSAYLQPASGGDARMVSGNANWGSGQDNDPEQSKQFVEQVYRELLSRPAEQSALRHWTEQLQRGMPGERALRDQRQGGWLDPVPLDTDGANQGTPIGAAPQLPWTARTIWAALRNLVAEGRPYAARHQDSAAGERMAPRRMAFDSLGGSPATGARPPEPSEVRAFVTSLGRSQGEAFRVQLLNRGRSPVILSGGWVVFEPLAKDGEALVRREMQSLAGDLKKAVTLKVEGYCVDYLLEPPREGTMFRIAPPDVQRRFEPARYVVPAARKLAGANRLHPDSDRSSYVESIKQYAVWTRLEHWDQAKFGEAFVDRTRKNLLAQRRSWTKDVEKIVRDAIPGRWRDVTAVLEAADAMAQSAPAAAPGGGESR